MEKINIQIDDREPSALGMLCLAEGLDVKVARLKVGDYVCGDLGVCIERKTIDDLCGSITDGRLESQILKMVNSYPHCYVLVSGAIKDRIAEMHEHSIIGMLVKLIVEGKVSVLMLGDDLQLVYAMKRIFERHKEASENGKSI